MWTLIMTEHDAHGAQLDVRVSVDIESPSAMQALMHASEIDKRNHSAHETSRTWIDGHSMRVGYPSSVVTFRVGGAA